jgi:hypothetical protein
LKLILLKNTPLVNRLNRWYWGSGELFGHKKIVGTLIMKHTFLNHHEKRTLQSSSVNNMSYCVDFKRWHESHHAKDDTPFCEKLFMHGTQVLFWAFSQKFAGHWQKLTFTDPKKTKAR